MFCAVVVGLTHHQVGKEVPLSVFSRQQVVQALSNFCVTAVIQLVQNLSRTYTNINNRLWGCPFQNNNNGKVVIHDLNDFQKAYTF